MAFFQSAVGVLQTLVVALGAGLGIWGAINLMEGYGNDNPGANAKEQAEVQTVPIQCKVALTIKEAAEYSNIGINKLECLLRSPRCPFVLYVGKKKLVKRKEFEKFISDNIEI